MSLRLKIILLFGVFSIAPLLGLAAFSYWQARGLLREVVQDQLEEEALSVAAGLTELRSEILESLEGVFRIGGNPPQGYEPSDSAPGATTGSVLERAAFVGVRGEDGSYKLLSGSVPQAFVRCTDGRSSHLVVYSSFPPKGSEGGIVEVGLWASDLVAHLGLRGDHSVALADREEGYWLLGESCDGEAGGDSPIAGSDLKGDPGDPGGRRIPPSAVGVREVRAVAPVAGLEWDVILSTSLDDVLGSLRSLTVLYWILVLALGAFTAVAFSMLISRFTESLSGLARTAEEIGLGELDPWLPVAASGELGQLTLAFSRMLERIRRMMSQVSQSGRLAVVGQLSAYLAHEIRNPLSSIKLNQQRILRWVEAGELPEYCRGPLEISLREVDRLSAAVTGVLQLSKANDSPREAVELRQLLVETTELLAPRFRRQGVDLLLDLNPEADLILARPGQIKSVALNLMVNALEAQPAGGRLAIRTTLCRHPETEGPAVSLHIQDEGPGIPSEIRDRIFEPFFTTKPGGAGIGLAMVSQAVEENGGQITLSPSFSSDGGAEFILIFPLAPSDSRDRVQGGMPLGGAADPFSPVRGSHGWEGGNRVGSSHLFTPGGLRAALSPSIADSEKDD